METRQGQANAQTISNNGKVIQDVIKDINAMLRMFIGQGLTYTALITQGVP
jgi:hypothetical protein